MSFHAPTLTTEATEALSLRDKWARAIAADRALSNALADHADEATIDRLSDLQFDTRDALYAELATLGIDRKLAAGIGAVLF